MQLFSASLIYPSPALQRDNSGNHLLSPRAASHGKPSRGAAFRGRAHTSSCSMPCTIRIRYSIDSGRFAGLESKQLMIALASRGLICGPVLADVGRLFGAVGHRLFAGALAARAERKPHIS